MPAVKRGQSTSQVLQKAHIIVFTVFLLMTLEKKDYLALHILALYALYGIDTGPEVCICAIFYS